ncbi:MAG: glycosyltransferase family 1 protein, partial [Proteobacteria bacterium]|nr:glycosyltransferase family 1 protein [Pseudomonadota bacterium]
FFIKPIFRILFRRKNYCTIFQNPDDRNLFEKLSLVNTQQTVLIRGSGVDTSEFVKTEDKNTRPVVMLASRMLWDKGIGEFVDAAKCAKKENIAADFCLVGDVDPENPMSIPISVLKQWRDEGYILW